VVEGELVEVAPWSALMDKIVPAKLTDKVRISPN